MQYSSSFIQHNQNTWYLARINSGTLTAFVSPYKHFVTHYIMTIGSVSKYDMVWIISLVFMEATSQKRPSCQNHRALVRLVAMTTTWSCHLDSIMCQLCFRYWLMTLCGTCLTTLLSLCTWMTFSLSPKMRGIHCVAKVCSQGASSVRLAKGSNPAHMITKKRSHWFSHSCGYIQAMLHNVRGLFMQGQSVENVFVKKGEKWTQCVSKMFQSLMDQFLFLHRGKWEAIVLGISTASVLREYNIWLLSDSSWRKIKQLARTKFYLKVQTN